MGFFRTYAESQKCVELHAEIASECDSWSGVNRRAPAAAGHVTPSPANRGVVCTTRSHMALLYLLPDPLAPDALGVFVHDWRNVCCALVLWCRCTPSHFVSQISNSP